MIAKVQEVKEGYKGTLSLLGAAKLRFRKYNTADIERLMIEVSADYNEVLRLEKEYFKPRNLKADMEFAIEDIETMDAHNFDCHRPTARMYIEKLEKREQESKKFDEIEKNCKKVVVVSCDNPHLKNPANWHLVETCDGKFWEIWKTKNGYLVAIDTDEYDRQTVRPPNG